MFPIGVKEDHCLCAAFMCFQHSYCYSGGVHSAPFFTNYSISERDTNVLNLMVSPRSEVGQIHLNLAAI